MKCRLQKKNSLQRMCKLKRRCLKCCQKKEQMFAKINNPQKKPQVKALHPKRTALKARTKISPLQAQKKDLPGGPGPGRGSHQETDAHKVDQGTDAHQDDQERDTHQDGQEGVSHGSREARESPQSGRKSQVQMRGGMLQWKCSCSSMV